MSSSTSADTRAPHVVDFPIDSASANISKITLTGRYPHRGYALNTSAEMIVYIMEGKITLHQDREISSFNEGSVILVKRATKYFWQPEGSVTLLIFSTPPWTAEQQQILL